jgi:hypothetical protein
MTEDPTTFDVQAVYFKWFQTLGENKDNDHETLLDALSTVSSTTIPVGNVAIRSSSYSLPN